MKNFIIGDSIAYNLAKLLDWEYLKIEERIFPDGEVLPKIEKEEKINQAILVFNKKEENINSYLIKFFFLSRKLKEISRKVIGILPYYPYARQDVVFFEGEPLSSLYLAELVEKNLDVFLTCNLHEHRKKISELFEIPAYNLSLFADLAMFFKDLNVNQSVIVGPDREAKAFLDDFSENFPAEKYVFLKQRDAKTGKINFLETEFDFSNKEVIIIDDILSTGKTLFEIAKKIKEKGVQTISFAFVHLLNKQGIELLKELKPKKIITTNTLDNNFYQLDITKSLANFLKEKIIKE
ncbi:MAG: ribose-phosphate diphosphokinase [Minisyncoccia bacterium]